MFNLESVDNVKFVLGVKPYMCLRAVIKQVNESGTRGWIAHDFDILYHDWGLTHDEQLKYLKRLVGFGLIELRDDKFFILKVRNLNILKNMKIKNPRYDLNNKFHRECFKAYLWNEFKRINGVYPEDWQHTFNDISNK